MKYKEIYDANQKNEIFDFSNFKKELNNCVNKCDIIYRQVLDHQIKGAEISYVISKYFLFKTIFL